jgi:hypothetical protein
MSIELNRRETLALLGSAPLLLGAPPVQAAIPTNVVTVLYKRESATAPSRLEPAVQAATMALEKEFIDRGFRVIQPVAEVYKMLDQGEGVIITFAEDAGFSLVFSAYADVRPAPGQEAGIAEMRLATRVYVGRNILVSDEGRGQMFTRLEAGNREFGMRRALELAARRAAADVAEKASRQLQALSPERINQMVGSKPTTATTAQVVSAPLPGAPIAAPGAAPVAVGMPMAPGGLPPAVAAPAAAMPPPVAPPVGLPAAPPGLAAPAAPMAPAPAPMLAAAGGSEMPPPKNRYALVIGMSDYSSVRAANNGWGISDLPGVARDCAFVVDSLAKMGYPSSQVTVLRDAQATGSNIRGVLKGYAAKATADDVVLVFISGHGGDKDESVSGFGMPILADFKPRDPGTLDFWELQSFIKNLRGRVVWINDTCHSGGAAKDVTSVVVSGSGVQAYKDLRGPDAQTVAGNAGPGQDFAILTACSPSEVSLETREGGLFTTTLFRGLLASGGKLPLSRVYAEGVQVKVIENSRQICKQGNVCVGNPQQTPTMAFNGRGNQIRV